MCGSNDIVKQDGLYICQYCGTKYSVEEAKKIMLEGKVKIDQTEELSNLYEIARRAKKDNNVENAHKYYQEILSKDPSSWEANFYTVYFQAMNCKVAEIASAAIQLCNSEESIIYLIKNNVSDSDEQIKALEEFSYRIAEISNVFFSSSKNFYDNLSYQVKADYLEGYVSACFEATKVTYKAGDYIAQIFGEDYGKIAANCWKQGVRLHSMICGIFDDKKSHADVIKSYNEKISKFDSSYEAPEIDMSGACYIATAVYGSYNCPEVWTLRRYRDYRLSQNMFGRAFVKTYYSISPSLVRLFGNTKLFKTFWKNILDRKIKKLQLKGYDSTPYNDKKWK